MKVYFYTQDFENYGTPDNAHWKPKGGSDFIIEADSWTEEMVQKVVDLVNYSGEMSQRSLIGYQEVSDTFMTQDEQFELEYEGSIEFGAMRCTYDEFLTKNEVYDGVL